jgi:RNA polymerase sigma factor (sigma-70 family)
MKAADNYPTDEELVLRFQQFPEERDSVVDVLYRRHRDWAMKVASSHLPPHSIDYAQDIVQDVLKLLPDRMITIKNPSRFRGFLARILRNKAINFRLRDGWHESRDPAELDTVESVTSIAYNLKYEEFEKWCETHLSKRRFRIVELHYAGGLRFKEIAERESISVGTVGWHLSEFRRIFKKSKKNQ